MAVDVNCNSKVVDSRTRRNNMIRCWVGLKGTAELGVNSLGSSLWALLKVIYSWFIHCWWRNLISMSIGALTLSLGGPYIKHTIQKPAPVVWCCYDTRNSSGSEMPLIDWLPVCHSTHHAKIIKKNIHNYGSYIFKEQFYLTESWPVLGFFFCFINLAGQTTAYGGKDVVTKQDQFHAVVFATFVMDITNMILPKSGGGNASNYCSTGFPALTRMRPEEFWTL